jgi:Zn-dependent M28 family amino/carboxypeptidase
VLIFNNGTEGRTAAVSGTLGAPVALPVVGTSFALGQSLFALGTSAVVHMVVQTLSETRETYNVIADTPGGNPNRIVTIGAHLDSVIDGPGIVDNGSGVGTLIEIARSLNQVVHINPTGDVRGNIRNKVRFFFWGAEELSLLGSAFYVQSLSPAEKAKILLNLNADMIASSNGIRFVFDGNASHTPPPATPLPQPLTGQIEQVFLDHFAAEGLATEPRQLDGRSDYQSFLAAGIPAGGLSAGSDQIKTAAQAAIYGGVPGPVHPCHHLACDRIDQTNVPLLEQMADAYAHAVLWFAMDGQPLKKDG